MTGPLIAVVTWVVVRVQVDSGSSDASWALPAACIGFACGVLLALEFLILAIRGGGLAPTAEGLAYHLGVANGVLHWADIAEATAERRTNAKGGGYPVLAISLLVGRRRWPPSIVLWGSTRDCLAVTPYIFRGSSKAVADGINGGPRGPP